MKYVRQSDRSDQEHTHLSQAEAMALLDGLQEPVRTMAWLDITTGLRINEVLGLRWSDIDFDAGVMSINRGVVYARTGRVKTEASRARMPLAKAVLASLQQWRTQTPYAAPADWVFASPRMKGRQPYWGNTMVKNHLRVAARAAGIEGSVGWHTFRRSISTWLVDNDENVKVAQELMRHSNVATTLGIYAKAVTGSKRRAHERIVDGLLGATKDKPIAGLKGEEFTLVG